MITLDLFKKAINSILDLEAKNDRLSEIIVGKDSGGWCDIGTEVIDTLIEVLHADFNRYDEDDVLFWWIYETDAKNKESRIIWEYTDDGAITYDLNELEDLYYYMCNDLKKVKQEFLKGVTKKQVQELRVVTLEELKTILGI